jgi:hypothetical protein
VAIFLARRIGEGARDAPRPVRPARQRRAVERDGVEREETERFWFDAPRQSERRLERYLDMPFGEAVGRICKGLGMQPDWAAWAAEPWAQEETRTRPEGSPYANDAGEPPSEQSERQAPPPLPLSSRKGAPAPYPGPPRAPPTAAQPPPPNRKARRAQAAKARHRAAPTRAPFARAAG